MLVRETALPGVLVIEPRVFEDNRGYFSETWNRKRFAAAGIDIDFVQDNHSLSREVGTVRGLHCQAPPEPQAKLVRCGRGRLHDVAVDVRRGSPTYGRWTAVELSAENHLQLFIPAGFLHGFITREPDTEIIYKCTHYYSADCEMAVRFDDPEIGIDWGIDAADAILSQRDLHAGSLRDFDTPFVHGDY